MSDVVLETCGLTKRYPGVTALDGVNVTLESATIHALVGENGAGKSTLIRILAGLVEPDDGWIRIRGEPACIARAGRRSGPTRPCRIPTGPGGRSRIAVVHQNAHLVPDLSVADNLGLRLGYPRTRIGRVARRRLRERTATVLNVAGRTLDPAQPARELTETEQQLVEIAFAFAAQPEILILDEPTAALPARETERLFSDIRTFAKRGGSVLFVTHRLAEVFELAQDVTVFRDGRQVWRKPIGETDADDVIRAMVGRDVPKRAARRSEPAREVALGLTSLTDREGMFRDVTLDAHRGEIFGIYGLVGAGQSELCRALLGLRPTSRGEIRLGQDVIDRGSPRARVRAGLGLAPAERRRQGLFFPMTVMENLTLALLPKVSERGWIRLREERFLAREMCDRLAVRSRGLDQGVAQLSGGNQQKVLLGRWLATDPKVLVLEEPTQGVDVGAKDEIHAIIDRLAAKGTTVVIVSSELPELLALCHRIGVMREGRLVAVLNAEEGAEEDILRAALPASSGPAPPTERDEGRFADAAPERDRERSDRRRPTFAREAGLAAFLACLCLVCGLVWPSFGEPGNLRDLLVNNVILLIGALGVSLVILAGGIDISIGAILALAAVAAGKMDAAEAAPVSIAAIAVGVGMGLGLANGAMTAFGRVHSIVITLGTLSIFRSLVLQITGGRHILNVSPATTWFGQARVFGIPVILLAGAGAFVLVHEVLNGSVTGRRIYATGSRREHAEVLGVPTGRVRVACFALCGALVGLGGLLYAGRYGQVQTSVGLGFELRAIAAAVIGGVSILGGRGSALGVLLGTLLLGVLTNVIILSRVSAFWEGVVVGALILIAVAVDGLAQRATTRRGAVRGV